MSAINERIRRDYEAVMGPAGALLHRMGLSPNLVTIFSVVLAGAAALAFAGQRLGLGLGFMVASVFVDMLDGSVARASGRATALGTLFDHTTDRYSEFLYVFGLCYGGYAPFWAGFLCYFSMLMPSYVRAKAESSGAAVSVQGVGIAERKEKIAALIISTALAFVLANAVFYGLIAIAVVSQISTFQRLHYVAAIHRTGEP